MPNNESKCKMSTCSCKHLTPCNHMLIKQEALEGEATMSMSSRIEEGAQQFKINAEADSRRRSLQKHLHQQLESELGTSK